MKRSLIVTFILLANIIAQSLKAEQESQKSIYNNVVLIPGTTNDGKINTIIVASKIQEIIEQLKKEPALKAKIKALQESKK